MEPKISRKKAKTATRLLWISVAVTFIGLMSRKWYITLIAFVFVVYGAVRVDKVSVCPHCGAYFRGLNPTESNAGYCRKCGKLMEFDEEHTE